MLIGPEKHENFLYPLSLKQERHKIMRYIEKKQIKRSKIRVLFGKVYYSAKRYKQWYFSGKKYSKTRVEEEFPYMIFTHSTPLIRKLKAVDLL